jgi:hypothetical protein
MVITPVTHVGITKKIAHGQLHHFSAQYQHVCVCVCVCVCVWFFSLLLFTLRKRKTEIQNVSIFISLSMAAVPHKRSASTHHDMS